MHLLPKPADWTAQEHVVGPLFDHLDLNSTEEDNQLPEQLKTYIESAKNDHLPVVYIGIGSMLGTLFDEAQITSVLNKFAEGAVLAQTAVPCRVIIHTTTGNASPGKMTYQPNDAIAQKAYFALNNSVPHRQLFPLCDFIITHGGAGSMHAALLTGVPTTAIPCG